MTDRIYKILDQDDVLATGQTEIVVFNDSVVEAVGNAYILRVNHKKPKGVSGNQALGQGTVDQQPQGILGEFYTIEGVIPFMDGTLDGTGTGATKNATITQMKAWSDGLDTKEGEIIHGMFGFDFTTIKDYEIIPISSGESQIGLLWVDLEWTYDLILNIAKFVLKFKVDRGGST